MGRGPGGMTMALPPALSVPFRRAARDVWRQEAELAQRVAFLAWLDCADGATRRQIAAEAADTEPHP